jgi:hypothetical protein
MATLNLFPSRIPFVNLEDGTLTPVAQRSLQIVQDRIGGVLGDGVASPAVLTGFISPFSYTPLKAGSVIIQGGTVTKIQYSRGLFTIDLAVLNGKFELQAGDTIKVTYAVTPTITFLPS